MKWIVCDRVIEKFKIADLKAVQRESLKNLVNMQDVFVIQPTGSGSFLIFQAAAMDFDDVKRSKF